MERRVRLVAVAAAMVNSEKWILLLDFLYRYTANHVIIICEIHVI